ncbi:hypothetical protein HH308_15780 [Gordonia sp. TBRC 11910]|uniref:Ig-like domain-containing protein n=1 Tax=Gordonia asplenii TaxID=2725283 RepID=A0A848KWQ1_9ACTN|nr:hypothetical protein [Gordonia asplenii]NMO02672.1 hypothetical protein [Gordonia asplenii]
MPARHSFTRLLGSGLLTALAVGALTVAAQPATAMPGITTVDSSVYATPGGHGNFRWRYAAGPGHECRIIPVGRTVAVECDATFPTSVRTASSTVKPNAVRLLGRTVTATTSTSHWAGAKQMAPYRQISVEGVTCTVLEHATVDCRTGGGDFTVVGGMVRR